MGRDLLDLFVGLTPSVHRELTADTYLVTEECQLTAEAASGPVLLDPEPDITWLQRCRSMGKMRDAWICPLTDVGSCPLGFRQLLGYQGLLEDGGEAHGLGLLPLIFPRHAAIRSNIQS